VNGGITVEAGGRLQLTRSTVNGGIVVLPCGELDVNFTTVEGDTGGIPTNTTATINGGIDIEAGNVCSPGARSDADIWTARIQGGISITGTFSVVGFAGFPKPVPLICGNDIQGSVHLTNVTVPSLDLEGVIGDPDCCPLSTLPLLNGCPGNSISGSFLMGNSSVFAVESNDIGGSVHLNASMVELNGNTIGGSLRCSNGTVILPGEATDPTGNTVHGKNTC
jgi:hypothetical protein